MYSVLPVYPFSHWEQYGPVPDDRADDRPAHEGRHAGDDHRRGRWAGAGCGAVSAGCETAPRRARAAACGESGINGQPGSGTELHPTC